MHFNAHLLFLPALFAMSGVLAQLAAEATGGSPQGVTYPSYGDAFVFCSAADCTGTCEVASGTAMGEEGDGEVAPNDMGYQSIYWYDPVNADIILYTCVDYYNCDYPPTIGPNACYNLYDNGVLTDYGWYWYIAAPGAGAP